MTDQPSNVDFNLFAKGIADAQEAMRPDPLPKGGGGGTSDGMGPWEQSVESRLTSLGGSVDRLGDKVDARFDTLIKAYAAGFVFMVLAFAGGFVMLSEKVDRSTERVATKLDKLSDDVGKLSERTAKLEGASETKPPSIQKPR